MKRDIALAVLVAALLPSTAYAASNFDGTWVGDATTYHATGKPVTLLLKDGMYSCKTCTPMILAKADGTDQKVTDQPYFDTIAIKPSGDSAIEITEKKGGTAVYTESMTVAADNKSATVEFDSHTAANGAEVKGKYTVTRMGTAPKGASDVSGDWMLQSVPDLSANALTTTYRIEGDMVHMTDPEGDAYDAKLGGPAVAVVGDKRNTMVAVSMAGKDKLRETYSRDGKTVDTTLSAVQGNTMKITDHDVQHSRTTTWQATKK